MAPSDTPSASTARRNDRFNNFLSVALIVGVAGIVVAWRRTHDPLRAWAKRVETGHARSMDLPLQRCFGTTDPVALRRIAEAVRHGPLPAPFRDCHGGPMTELAVSPSTFVESLRDPPLAVYRLRDRERAAINRLGPTLRRLEIDVDRVRGTATDAQRTSIADRLDESIAEIEQEQRATSDLVHAARDAAPVL